jgi:hypothetical protein
MPVRIRKRMQSEGRVCVSCAPGGASTLNPRTYGHVAAL